MKTNEKIETLSSNDALEFIIATANAPSLEHQRINPDRVRELASTLGAWNRPKIVATRTGVIIQGADYLAALVASGSKAEVVLDRGGKATRRPKTEASSLVETLERAGVQHAAFRLAVYRGVREAGEANPKEEGPRQLAERLSDQKFAKAFEALHAPYEMISPKSAGSKASRVRSKIAFAAFLLAYHANPKLVVKLYTDFLSGSVEKDTPVAKLLHAVRTDNINTGSGRRPFMLKAAVLLKAQLEGEHVDRAVADEVRGQEAVSGFLGGNA